MSLLPFFVECELERPRRLIDQHFGLGLTPQDLLYALDVPVSSSATHSGRGYGDYYRPWRQLAATARDIGSTIKQDKDKFQMSLDVQHFAPEEISVKTVDGFVVVEGKHEEKKDEHGYVSRQFVRRYALPEGCDASTVESRLSSDGVLTVVAPRKPPPALAGERHVPIAQTGPIRKQPADDTTISVQPPASANGDAK